jgi:hypothetical protein
MLLETDNAPRTAVEQEDGTNAWLERVEASVENAYAVLLTPQRGSLPQFVSEMEWAARESSGLAVHPELAPRLAALQVRLNLVRSMLRQAAAFEQAREQLKTELVLGYTPTGLERALQ